MHDGSAERLPPVAFFRIATLVTFLNAGLFKAEPHLARFPIDLTVLFAACLLVELGFMIARKDGELPWAAGALFLLFALFLPTVLWTTWWPYAIDKAVRFFTLTLLAAIAPIYLVTSARALRIFVIGFLIVALILCIGAGFSLLGGRDGLLRLSALGAATISFSRAAGMGLIAVVYLRSKKEIGLLTSVVVGSVLVLAMIGSGSRGPLLSLVPAVAVYTFVVVRPNIVTALKVGLILVVGLLGWQWIEPYVPIAPLARLATFAHGRLGSSELERLAAVRASLVWIPTHPFGLGLGGFQRLNVLVGSPRQFPHNIVLEAWLEGGWAAGTVFVALCCIGLLRLMVVARQRLLRPEAGVLLSLFVFLLLNDLVSGELNDSKILFAVIGLALSFPRSLHMQETHTRTAPSIPTIRTILTIATMPSSASE